MRQIFVHCGLHKTGTTALQTVLMRNAGLLAARGILIPKTGRMDALGGGHHNIAWQAARDRRFDPNIGTLETLCQEISAFNGTAILSSEDFETILDDPALIERFAASLKDCRSDICFVIYLRNQLDYCESIFIENLVQNIGTEYPRYVRDIIRNGKLSLKDWAFQFDYQRMLEICAATGARLIVRNFHDLHLNSTIADFLSIVPTEIAGFDDSLDTRPNKRLPTPQALRFFYKNRVGRSLGENEQRAFKILDDLIGGRRLVSLPATAAAFGSAFAESNRAICRDLGLAARGLDLTPEVINGPVIHYEKIFCFELQQLIGQMRPLLATGKARQAEDLALRFVLG